MYNLFKKIMLAMCRISIKHPYAVLVLIAILCVPAFFEVRKITIDPGLVRLLPTEARASKNTRTLSAITGDGGYFTLILTADNTNQLVAAADAAAALIRPLEGIHTVEYEWPVEFLEEYRYLLVPNDYLFDIHDKILGWKSELSPAGVNLFVDEEIDERDSVQSERESSLEGDIRHYATLSRYHFSADEQNLGLIIRTTQGIDEFQQMADLYKSLTNIAANIRDEHAVEAGIAGSHRNKIDEFNVINNDIALASLISGVLILIVTAIGFRSIRTAFVVIAPLAVGMVWGFGFIPSTVGDLNLITSFLMILLAAMGIDYTMHLVKRVQQELVDKPFAEALEATYRSTGPSVFISGLTTAFALSMLAFSSFRGFSDFGVISVIVILTILISTIVCMPAVMVVAHRFGFLPGHDRRNRKIGVFSRRGTIIALSLVGVCVLLAGTGLKFDASFRNLEFDRSKIEGLQEARAAQRKVYSSSFSPGAIFMADDLENLDRLLEIFNTRIEEGIYLTNPVTNMIDGVPTVTYKTNRTTIDVARSLRDYSPIPQSWVWEERLEELRYIQEELREGDWIDRIENPDRQRWITEMRDWVMPPNPQPPTIEDIIEIESISASLLSKDGTNKYLVAVFPSVDRKSANNAIRFTDEIYRLVPESQAERDALGIGGVLGPVGETPVFAEMVKIVKSEVWWVAGLTFFGMFVLIWFEFKKIRQAFFVMIPLLIGFAIIFGIMAILSMNLNLFNVIMIPALLGLGLDNGIHMFTRWKEFHGNTKNAVSELFFPLFLCDFTTMLGYVGMIFVAHPGLRSIGMLAVLGMMILWAVSVFIMPGMLEHFMKKRFLSAAELKDSGT
jgi:hypothetical protein